MNAQTKATPAPLANIARAGNALTDYFQAVKAGRDEEWFRLHLVLALKAIDLDDLDAEEEALRWELRIDSEGYPLDDDGFTDFRADRVFVPASVGGRV